MPRKRPNRLTIGLVLLGALVIVAIVIYKPWRPIRFGWATPPSVATHGLEPALVNLIGASTAEVRRAPYSADAWGRLGLVYDVHGLPGQAADCYTRAQRLDPSDFRWIYFLALCAQESGRRDAREHLLAARALRDDYAPLELHLARSFFDSGDLLQAETHFQRAAALDAALVRPHVGLARIALARDDPQRALAHLNSATSRKPKGSEVDFLLAETHRRLGNAEAAARYADRAGDRAAFEEFSDRIRMESQWEVGVTMFWRETRSRSYLQAGMVDRAIAEWRQVLAEDPGSARAWSEVRAIFAGAGESDRAIDAYGRALAIDPGLHAIRHQLGLLLVRSGRTDAGLTMLRESCEALPESADLRANLAIALTRNGRDAEAAASYARAGALYAAQGRLDRAAETYRQAIARRPDGVDERRGLAAALRALGRHAEARVALERAVERAPDHAAATADLAWLLATCSDETQRDAAAAVRLIEPLARAAPPEVAARALDTLAAAHAARGDFEDAVRTAEAALSHAQGADHTAIAARLEGYRARKAFTSDH